MLGKIINGKLVTPTAANYKKVVITNPTDDDLKYVFGFKDLIEEEKPEYDTETTYLNPVYTETDTEIHVSWEVKEFDQPILEEEQSVE